MNIEQIYNKWDDLKKQAAEDCKAINKAKLDQEFNLSELQMKWLNYHADWQRVYFIIENKRRKLKRELYEYYKIDFNIKIDTKDDLTLFIESDEKFVEILNSSQIVKSIVTYCENVIDKLKTKAWEIKNWIDYQKWVSGG